MKRGLSVNKLAWRLLEELLEKPDYYGIKVENASSGATIVDAGIKAKGGFQAGKIITEICMGGCGKAEITSKKYGRLQLPSIFVYTDHPAIATFGSQYAGWRIKEGDYFAIGSGPARALALKPKKVYDKIGYSDDFHKAIAVLETAEYPPTKVLKSLTQECKVSPDNMTVILTPTASTAGATQISGRIVETGIHKLDKLGLDPKAILSASGCAPIPPIHPKFVQAMARTNDAILYGGIAYYFVQYDDDEEELKRIVSRAPSSASEAYGKPFIEIFKEANYNFYEIDPNLFGPAVLIVNNMRTGRIFRTGKINVEALEKSSAL